VLRSNLEVSLADIDQPVVIVTSSKPNEGKTVVCANLALSFAQAGRRVVMVDLDLRHSTAHRLLGAHNEFGVSDVLLGQRSLQECLQPLDLRSPSGTPVQLYFLGTGPPVHNPTELLGTSRTARMLEGLARQADLVLVDSPPVLPVADTLVIGRIASGAILVIETHATAFQSLEQAKALLIRNQTRLLGVVMNKFHARDAESGYGYGYGYGYGSTADVVADAAVTPPDLERPNSNGTTA
jgi:receptor protein-tyrosine kinase